MREECKIRNGIEKVNRKVLLNFSHNDRKRGHSMKGKSNKLKYFLLIRTRVYPNVLSQKLPYLLGKSHILLCVCLRFEQVSSGLESCNQLEV